MPDLALNLVQERMRAFSHRSGMSADEEKGDVPTEQSIAEGQSVVQIDGGKHEESKPPADMPNLAMTWSRRGWGLSHDYRSQQLDRRKDETHFPQHRLRFLP